MGRNLWARRTKPVKTVDKEVVQRSLAVRRHRLYDLCQRKVHAFCNRTYTTRNGHRENKRAYSPSLSAPPGRAWPMG